MVRRREGPVSARQQVADPGGGRIDPYPTYRRWLRIQASNCFQSSEVRVWWWHVATADFTLGSQGELKTLL